MSNVCQRRPRDSPTTGPPRLLLPLLLLLLILHQPMTTHWAGIYGNAVGQLSLIFIMSHACSPPFPVKVLLPDYPDPTASPFVSPAPAPAPSRVRLRFRLRAGSAGVWYFNMLHEYESSKWDKYLNLSSPHSKTTTTTSDAMRILFAVVSNIYRYIYR